MAVQDDLDTLQKEIHQALNEVNDENQVSVEEAYFSGCRDVSNFEIFAAFASTILSAAFEAYPLPISAVDRTLWGSMFSMDEMSDYRELVTHTTARLEEEGFLRAVERDEPYSFVLTGQGISVVTAGSPSTPLQETFKQLSKRVLNASTSKLVAKLWELILGG